MLIEAETIISVWEKGRTITPNDPTVYRKDECGAWIHYPSYGDRDSRAGKNLVGNNSGQCGVVVSSAQT